MEFCRSLTLILGGQNDPRVPVEKFQELANKTPYARLQLISDAGHFLPLEKPSIVCDLSRDWYEER